MKFSCALLLAASLVSCDAAFVPSTSQRSSIQNLSIKNERLIQSLSTTKAAFASSKTQGYSSSLQMAMYPVIDEWQVVSAGGVKGVVTDSPIPEIEVGEVITTSKLVTSDIKDGTIVETESGSRYILGAKKQQGFSFFGGKKAQQVETEAVVTEPTPAKKRPAPFGSVGRGLTKGAGRDVKSSNAAAAGPVPVINDWIVNNREEVVGVLSNGKKITTSELSTNIAFAETGFTVVTVDDKKYKLGTPRGGAKTVEITDDTPTLGTPTLNNWDMNLDGRLVGAIRGSDNRIVPDGTQITTDKIISEADFIDEGFTVVSESGRLYKLGKKSRESGSASNATPAVSLPAISLPSFGGNSDSKEEEEESEKAPSKPFFSFGKKDEESSADVVSEVPKKAPAPVKSAPAPAPPAQSLFSRKPVKTIITPTIDNWAVTGAGGVSGNVRNSPNPEIEDGEFLTTSKLENDVNAIYTGTTVTTINGSKYVLGTKRPVSKAVVEKSPAPILAGAWFTAVIVFALLAQQ
ncbi:predicted protein [Chaetoceros tenuissimus]|uniref:Uncharacterized protein n=1 Tax=Chaetoceros tenuissimus TaxID=426638 RepID=A0AAD3DBQ5_9STRA|nr:predicted protein [Chaetoceros tenuissimus]